MLLFVPLAATGCYLSHDPPVSTPDSTDDGCLVADEPTCVAPEEGPCSRPIVVDAVCEADGRWTCPDGARTRETVEDGTECLPFFSDHPPLDAFLGGGQLVETAEGECAWIAGEGRRNGLVLQHPVLLSPGHLPFGACPTEATVLRDTLIDDSRIGDDLVEVMDTVPIAGASWVTYQLYEPAPGEVFGVRSVGTSLAAVDPVAVRLTPSLEPVPHWEGFAFGDSAVRVGDELYLYGCRGPVDFLDTECAVARAPAAAVTDASAYRYWAGDDVWSERLDDAVAVLRSGPDTSVRQQPDRDRFVLTYVLGFGDRVEIRTASTPQGPWSDVVRSVACDLPADDPDAFCRDAIQHVELTDPLDPDLLVVSYSIATLAPDRDERIGAHPERYWPRLVWIRVP